MRAIIKYARWGAARFISHLDMQRAFARAVRRAELPVKYSEGFNPHILMSFASPLSVGIATMGDYLEVQMREACAGDEIKGRLSAVMPPDISIVYAGSLEENCPKLMSISHSASYEMDFEQELDNPTFMQSESCVVQDRKGRTLDLRPLVYELSQDEKSAVARVANSSTAALNPIVLAKALGGGEALITRRECFCLLDGVVTPFWKLGK